MPETKTKKLRIYKFASEYNLSTDSLVDFLKDKGYEIKGHMSLLTDDMISDIAAHFKKDIEKAEKHYRKISEFNKKRSDAEEKPAEEKEPEPEPKEEAEEKISETGEAVTAEEVDESVEEEIEEKESEVEAAEEEVKAFDSEEIPAEQLVKAEEESPEEVLPVSEEPLEISEEEPAEVQNKSFKTPAERELEKRRKGLTVVGKIDLGGRKKAKKEEKKEEPAKEEGKDKTSREVKPGENTDELASKKKKKRLKAKKKTGKEVEEDKTKRKKRTKRVEVDKRDVEEALKRTLSSIDEVPTSSDRASARKRKRKEKLEVQEKIQEEKERESSIIKVNEFIAVNELANIMDVPVSEVIQKCISLGLMVSINQRLDMETITLVADEFGFEVEKQEEFTAESLEDFPDPDETLKDRSPVVTIMGHVDHGKTSLLDYIRHSNVVSGESGGITQHIGAYRVKTDDGKSVTFLDTPGHEAFTAMRARGASVTDIVVLIVAADDAVMPQTVEAINHAQAAGVPIVIAINKVDKPGANSEKIRQQLADRNILVEDWGGKYQSVEVSAKTGLNIDLLLEKILLEADLLELKANPDRNARGVVVESQLDKGRGITSTILIQKGTLSIGDPFVAGVHHGRVRAMFDERNNKVETVGPSTPVLVLGFEGAPQAGDAFVVVDGEREARDVSTKRQQLKREQDQRQVKLITLDEIAYQISQGGVKELPLIVKGDVDGSVEALSDSLMKISNNEVIVQVIHKGVGGISEGDVLLAAASNAIIIGFHVRPNLNARKLAESEKVDIRLYNVIYDAINEVKSALEGMLSPIISEEIVGNIEVRDTFKVPKVGTIAGCYVLDGKVTRNSKIRLIRDGIVTYEGELATLKRFKDDVKEVDAGYECGLNIANFNDIKVGDIVEVYKFVETKKKLT